MAFTLNMAEHVVAGMGQVARTLQSNPSFDGVRLYRKGGRPPIPAYLYVCSCDADAQAVAEAGCHAVLVRAGEGAPAGEAALELVCDGRDFDALDVFDALLESASRYDAWERSMDRIAHEGGSLQDLVDASEPFLLNNVVVLDPALKLLAYTQGVPCDDPITMELIEHGYHTEDNIRKFKLHKRFDPWAKSDGFVVNDTHAICKYVTVVKSFKARTAFSLITVMMCNVAEPKPHLLDVFSLFVDRVETFARRDYPDDKPSGSAVDTFLKDLIDGSMSEADVVERCRYVGIPGDARFCLFYTKTPENSVPGLRLLSDVSIAVAPAKTVLVDDAVVVLCFNCANRACALHCISQACPNKQRTVSQRLDDILGRYDLTCGRSSKFVSLADVPVAFRQAREAWELSRKHASAGTAFHGPSSWERILSFDACWADCLMGKLTREDAALLGATYAESLLDDIAAHDAATGTNNYEFLHSYLLFERRASVVAEQLHMHRNNVGYRINRIEELYGIDTDDAQLRQDLLLAYRLRAASFVQNA